MDDIPNWVSLIVEIAVALFAIVIAIFFYKRENKSRALSIGIIKRQSSTLDQLSKDNSKQKEMIESMSEIIESQQLEIKEREIKKFEESKYTIQQFIIFLDSIEKICKEFTEIKKDNKKIELIDSHYGTLTESSISTRIVYKQLEKISKEMALSSLTTILPEFPKFSNFLKLLEHPPDSLDIVILDLTRSIYFLSKENFEFNGKKLPKILYEDLETLELFLKMVSKTKNKFKKIITS